MTDARRIQPSDHAKKIVLDAHKAAARRIMLEMGLSLTRWLSPFIEEKLVDEIGDNVVEEWTWTEGAQGAEPWTDEEIAEMSRDYLEENEEIDLAWIKEMVEEFVIERW